MSFLGTLYLLPMFIIWISIFVNCVFVKYPDISWYRKYFIMSFIPFINLYIVIMYVIHKAMYNVFSKHIK